MGLPKDNKRGRGMFDEIKSKLGFASPDQNSKEEDFANPDFDNRSFSDEFGSGYNGYDNYDDYDSYNSYDNYNDYNDYGSYGDYADSGARPLNSYNAAGGAGVSTRPASTSYPSYSTRPPKARPSYLSADVSTRASAVTPPRLVSIDDVRAHTQVPESLNRDPLPPRRVTSTAAYRDNRTMVDSALRPSANTPNARAFAAQNKERSESLNTLFSSTTPDMALPKVTNDTTSVSDIPAVASPSSAPYRDGSRSIVVMSPLSYSEAERITTALRAGEVVVLVLEKTPDDLAKRILDFSFGASSALDAAVEFIANKVFVITRGNALTDAEKASLRKRGVL